MTPLERIGELKLLLAEGMEPTDRYEVPPPRFDYEPLRDWRARAPAAQLPLTDLEVEERLQRRERWDRA